MIGQNLIYMIILIIKFASSKYEEIKEWKCTWQHMSQPPFRSYHLNLICGEIKDKNDIVNFSTEDFCEFYGLIKGKSYCRAIKFSDCQFKKIKHNFFKEFENLISFDISGVELENLDTRTFSNATNLKMLIASHNELSEIPPQLFINAVQIESVDFSNNIIQRIHPLAFENAVNLKTLIVSNNRLAKIPLEIFTNAINIESLDFSNKFLKQIDPSTFESAGNLKKLIISSNYITEIPSKLFSHVVKIERIDLSNNTIQCIKPMTFENNTNLKALNLSHNEIRALKTQCFSMVTSLLTLDLSHNNVTHLSEHIFDSVHNLEYLDMSFIPVDNNLSVGTFAYLSNLKFLSLSNTNITTIQPGTFLHQHELLSLDLSVNKLKEIDFKSVFLPILHNLQSLNLSHNQLTELNSFHNISIPKLTTLDIRSNQFNCTYLKNLIDTMAWEKFQTTNDPMLTFVNIGGIHCTPSVNETNETQQHGNCSGTISSLTFCIFVILYTILIAIIVILGHKRLLNKNSGDPMELNNCIARELL